MTTATMILTALYCADLFVGLYHLITDRGWNIRQQVIAFEAHHHGGVVFDLKPVYFAMPVVALGFYLNSVFVVVFACSAGMAEICHYYAHSVRPPWLARQLQYLRIIIRPEIHATHHDGRFDHSFCVLSGWANPLVDRIAPFIAQRRR